MKTISIIGQKGGTGKTTLAQILVVAAEQAGVTAAGIDLDPQVSLCAWADLRSAEAPAITDAQPGRLTRTLETARKEGVGLCVIDTAGRAEEASLAACKAADLVLIPVQPSLADLSTVEAALNLVRLAGAPPNLAILTRVKPRGERHKETMEWLKAQGLEVCPAVLGDRVTYQDAFAAGQTPQEFEPGGKAAAESKQVYEFVCKLINL
jgi:chromosome partitioning protein